MGEGFPLWCLVSMAWEGREPLRDWICLSVSLCFCVLPAALSPFRVYMEIRKSDWIETFAEIFLLKIIFLAAEEGHQPPYGGPTRVRGTPRGVGRAPLRRASLEHRLAWIFLPIFSEYSKNNLRPFLSRLDSV